MSQVAPNDLRNRLARLVVNVDGWNEAAKRLGLPCPMLKRITWGHHVRFTTIERFKKEIDRVEGKT